MKAQVNFDSLGGGGSSVNEISGYTAEKNYFSAIVGHRYIVFMGDLGANTAGVGTITGIDIEDETPDVISSSYSNLNCTMKAVIGTATASTITFAGNGTLQYNNVIWIDLDAQ